MKTKKNQKLNDKTPQKRPAPIEFAKQYLTCGFAGAVLCKPFAIGRAVQPVMDNRYRGGW